MDTVQKIEWSADSQFILCGMYKRGLVQVWSLEQPEWKCKIDEGSAGLCGVRYVMEVHFQYFRQQEPVSLYFFMYLFY